MLRKLTLAFLFIIFIFKGCDESRELGQLSKEEVFHLYNLAVYYTTWRPRLYGRVCNIILSDELSMDSVSIETNSCKLARISSRRYFDSRLNGKTLKLTNDNSMLNPKIKGMINYYLETQEPNSYQLPPDFEYFNDHWFDGQFYGHKKSALDRRWQEVCHIQYSNLFFSEETNIAVIGFQNYCGSHGPTLPNLIFFKKFNKIWFPYHFYIEPN